MEDNEKPKRGRKPKDETIVYVKPSEEPVPNDEIRTFFVELADKAVSMKARGAIVVVAGPNGVRYAAIGDTCMNDPNVMDAVRYLASKPKELT